MDIENSIVNITSGKSISILEIAEKVRDIYCNKIGNKAMLSICSDTPEHNKITFQPSSLDNMGFQQNDNMTLASEIEKLFHLLTKE
jgi:hypothetical protein